MNIENKIEIIKENSEAAIASLNVYLDRIYEMIDNFFEDGKLKEGLTSDKKFESFLLELREDVIKYEAVRRKLIDKNFNLSLVEINHIALGFVFINKYWQDQIETLKKAIEESNKIIENLMSENENPKI